MRVQEYGLQMAASHQGFQQLETRESLQIRTTPARPAPAVNSTSVTLSPAGREAQAMDDPESESAVDSDPRFVLLRRMVELITGHSIRTLSPEDLRAINGADAAATADAPAPSALPTATPAGFGIEYQYHAEYTESERSDFAAAGRVRTADGREINFQLQLSLSRTRHEESNVRLRLGNQPATTDPLILNFSGTSAQLSDQRFAFDLDADGQDEQLHLATGGSGFLVFDRNGDGQANDGRELFGPISGDGFAELAALDDDGNGWIDEGDAAFGRLGLWQQGQKRLLTLAEADVGALALQRVATPFSLRSPEQESLGELRSTGVFLRESGGAGTIQQIDLSV